mmetsp:Transcript_16753/g.47807  ORF Transcript_16753/g.47807 Transcript_16753/m.47807 type:complete len:286 (+) Transcript_16753:367-1224(+)
MHFRAAMVRRYNVSLRSSCSSFSRMHSRTSASCPCTRSISREVSSCCATVFFRSWPWSRNILESISQSFDKRSTASRDFSRSLSIAGKFSLAILAFFSASSIFSFLRLVSSYFQPCTSLSSLCTLVICCLVSWSFSAHRAVSCSTSCSKPVWRICLLLESSCSRRMHLSNHFDTSLWRSAIALLLPEGSLSGMCTWRLLRRFRRPLSRDCISRSAVSRRYCTAVVSVVLPPLLSPFCFAWKVNGPGSIAAGRLSEGTSRYLHGRLSVLEKMCTTCSAICTMGPSA